MVWFAAYALAQSYHSLHQSRWKILTWRGLSHIVRFVPLYSNLNCSLRSSVHFSFLFLFLGQVLSTCLEGTAMAFSFVFVVFLVTHPISIWVTNLVFSLFALHSCLVILNRPCGLCTMPARVLEWPNSFVAFFPATIYRSVCCYQSCFGPEDCPVPT